MSTNQTLLQVVANYMSRNGLKKKEVAEKIGISAEHFSRIINGHQILTEKMEQKIFSTLDDEARTEWGRATGKVLRNDSAIRRKPLHLLLEAWGYKVICSMLAVVQEDALPDCIVAYDGVVVVLDQPLTDEHIKLLYGEWEH